MSNVKGNKKNKAILKTALKNSFVKLDPRLMIKNPVMFVVFIGCILTFLSCIFPGYFGNVHNRIYNVVITLVLFITLLFANFAESLAEGRGKAQADSLKKTKKDTEAKLIDKNGKVRKISSEELKKGDIVLVEANDIVPGDGEIIEGIASVDESAITGESAAVIKEAGGDFSSVTGGTKVVSNSIKVKITVSSGESFLDKMISLVEGASRQKTPNEMALSTLLVSLTIIFLSVVLTLTPISSYVKVNIDIATLVALLVCLIPTTIGGLLSAIGIAGMDRVTKFNVIAMSGRAVEVCGDIDTMLLDKTGTITFGNRMADEFIPVNNNSLEDCAYYAMLSSIKDNTPEGRSIVELAKDKGFNIEESMIEGATFIEFTAETRMSGTTLSNGTSIRKGAYEAVVKYIQNSNGEIPTDLEEKVHRVSKLGGTPLVLVNGNIIIGVIYLKDIVKPGMKERFDKLRAMGIKTIMVTGDNKLTAKTIAEEAGVDDFLAESKPEDKIAAIKKEQAEGRLVAMTGDGTNDAPALAQADVGLAMNSGTIAAKEAANMVDLDSDPTKIIEVVEIGKQLLMTRGSLTTFSIANDVAKYFAIIPAIMSEAVPSINALNIMGLHSPKSAILSALIFNALIIPALIPIAMKGIKYKPMSATKLLAKNMLIFGIGGIITPFIGIKIIDLIVSLAF